MCWTRTKYIPQKFSQKIVGELRNTHFSERVKFWPNKGEGGDVVGGWAGEGGGKNIQKSGELVSGRFALT